MSGEGSTSSARRHGRGRGSSSRRLREHPRLGPGTAGAHCDRWSASRPRSAAARSARGSRCWRAWPSLRRGRGGRSVPGLILPARMDNLLRAAGTLASARHARAAGATLRRHLVHVPAPPGPQRPPARPAPARALALGRGLDCPVHRHPRATRRGLTTPTAHPGPEHTHGTSRRPVTGRPVLPSTTKIDNRLGEPQERSSANRAGGSGLRTSGRARLGTSGHTPTPRAPTRAGARHAGNVN